MQRAHCTRPLLLAILERGGGATRLPPATAGPLEERKSAGAAPWRVSTLFIPVKGTAEETMGSRDLEPESAALTHLTFHVDPSPVGLDS